MSVLWSTRGVELELTGYIFKRNDFDWSVNFNLTHYKNKITALAPEVEANGGIKGEPKISVLAVPCIRST